MSGHVRWETSAHKRARAREGSGAAGESKTLESSRDRLSKPEQWQLCIPRMGIHAMLKNLRAFDEAGVPDAAVRIVHEKLCDPEVIRNGRLLPLQILVAHLNTSSARWLPSLEKAMQLCLPNVSALPRNTLIVIDTSASMNDWLGKRPERALRPGEREPVRPRRVEAAALFALALALRNAGRVSVWGFADGQFQVRGAEPGASLLRAVEVFRRHIGSVGHGTRIEQAVRDTYRGEDRVAIFTDMQAFPPAGGWGLASGLLGADRGDVTQAVPEHVPVYAFNLAGYEASGMAADGKRNRHELGGLTDAMFALIPRIEAGMRAAWPWEAVS